jgi:hypothetical protein
MPVFLQIFKDFFVPLSPREDTFARKSKEMPFFPLLFAHLFVPLETTYRKYSHSKEQNIFDFILFFARLFVPLQRITTLF